MLAFDLIVSMLAMSQAPEAPQAAQAPTAEPQSQVEVVAPTPRRVCRMVQQRGSHLNARRVCETTEERDARIEEAQRDIADTLEATNSRAFADRWQPDSAARQAERGNIRLCGMRGPC